MLNSQASNVVGRLAPFVMRPHKMIRHSGFNDDHLPGSFDPGFFLATGRQEKDGSYDQEDIKESQNGKSTK